MPIITGDCVEVLNGLEPGSATLVFADPPYNIGVKYDKHGDMMPPAEYLSWCDSWIRAAVRTLKPDGSMWVLIKDEWVAEFDIRLRQAGLHRRSWVTWYETFSVNCTRKFYRTKRHLLYMVHNPHQFTFNRSAVSTQSDRQKKYNDKRANP
jgi:DNA modification methylase